MVFPEKREGLPRDNPIPYPGRTRSLLRKVRRSLKDVPSRLKGMPFSLRLGELAHRDLILKQHTGKLLSSQFEGTAFAGEDIFVDLMALEELFGLHGGGVELYRQMRHFLAKGPGKSRGLDREVSHLKDLAERISKEGFRSDTPIQMDRRQRLMGGSHLLAIALYFRVREVPIKVLRGRSPGGFDIRWFERAGFSSGQMERIIAKRRQTFREWGLHFPVILWPPVREYFDEIERNLARRYPIISSRDYDFREDGGFALMVEEVYRWEAIAKDLIDMKIGGMVRYPLRVRFMTLEVPDPEFEKGKKGNPISRVVKYLKEDLRKAYAGRVDNYFRDIVMHMGDNFDHNLHVMKVFEGLDPAEPPGKDAAGKA